MYYYVGTMIMYAGYIIYIWTPLPALNLLFVFVVVRDERDDDASGGEDKKEYDV